MERFGPKKYEEIISKIRQGFTRPSDLKNEVLILGDRVVPVILTKISGKEEEAYKEQILHVESSAKTFVKQSIRNDCEEDIIWDIEEHEGRIGVFTEGGRFVLRINSQYYLDTLWFLKPENSQMLGPFTTEEMETKLERGELENTMIKRSRDVVFIAFNEMRQFFPKIFHNEIKAEEIFLEEKLKHESESRIASEKNRMPPAKNMSVISEEEIHGILKSCTRSKDFLLKKKSSIDVIKIEQKIRGLSKSESIKVISDITKMHKFDSEMFLDMLISESKIPICCNVDSEGFELVT